METEPRWLDEREKRVWLSYMRMRRHLAAQLNQRLLQETGLSEAEYEVLVALTAHPDRRMPAHELRCQLAWEKSRLSHQLRRMEQRGMVTREPNPEDARSAVVALTEEGHRAITEAAPKHVSHVRQHFLDVLSPAEQEFLFDTSERVLAALEKERPSPGPPDLGEDGTPC